MRNTFTYILLQFLLFSAVAQNTLKNQLVLRAFVNEKNQVLLRWASGEKSIWELGNKYGYLIQRIPWDNTSEPNQNDFKNIPSINAFPIKPFEKENKLWDTLIRQNPPLGILFHTLFPSGKPSKKPLTPEQKAAAEKLQFSLVLIGADLYKPVAQYGALFFKDSTCFEKRNYAYRISINTPPSLGKTIEAFCVINNSNPSTLHPVSTLAAQTKRKQVWLSWNASILKKEYTGYIIERGTDSMNTTRINPTPVTLVRSQYEKDKTHAGYTDTIEPGKIYYYRIKGISMFGLIGPPSPAIKVISKREFNSYPTIDSSKTVNTKFAQLWFSMKNKNDKALLKKYFIMRADKESGPYKIVSEALDSSVHTFSEEPKQYSNYYKVLAINLDGDTAVSHIALVKLPDVTPPLSPKALSGKIYKTGLVQLKWNKNTEPDLKGYRVFRGNALKEEFIELTRKFATDTFYTDSIPVKTLTKKVFYVIRAVDKSFNISPASDTIALIRPDVIAPVAPVITQCTFNNTGVELKWIATIDTTDEALFLKRKNNTEEKVIQLLFTNQNSYLDTTVIYEANYKYSLIIKDKAENQSESKSATICFKPSIRKNTLKINAKTNRTKAQIEIDLNYQASNIDKIILYKSKSGEQARIFQTLNAGELSYIDKEISVGNTYIYKFKVVYTDGSQSIMSNEYTLTY